MNIRHLLLVLAALTGFAPVSCAPVKVERSAITCTAVDAGDGSPISGVLVEIPSLNISSTTNAFGQVEFSMLAPGTYCVTASKPKFKDASAEVLAERGKTGSVTFRMEELPEEVPDLPDEPEDPDTPDPGDNPDPGFARTEVFDPGNVVLSFGAISDVHIASSGLAAEKFGKALQMLKTKAAECDPDGLDAVCVAGDLINNAYRSAVYYPEETALFKSVYEGQLDPEKVPMIYCTGNHDVPGQWTSSSFSDARNLSDRLGQAYFKFMDEARSRTELDCRHSVVGDVHFLSLTPNGMVNGNSTFPQDVRTWLDTTLASLTSVAPDRYVVVLTHPMIHNTVYGSDLRLGTTSWYTDDLKAVLDKYPQTVTFSGHLHFPLNDPRSIMQDSFTSVGCASVSYMAIENGGYEDMSSATVMKDCQQFSQGWLVQLDRSGNMRLSPLDFYNNATIGKPYELRWPEGTSHLTSFTRSGREAANSAPTATQDISLYEDEGYCTLEFGAFRDDEFVHDYKVTVSSASGAREIEKKILADFYLHPDASDMRSSYSLYLGQLSAARHSVEIVATDSWGASASASSSFEVKGESAYKNVPSELYADIRFGEGKVTDRLGHLKITNCGATVAATEVSAGGRSKKVDALVTAGKDAYVLCEFSEIGSAAKMSAFAAGGFTVEAFYLIPVKGSAAQAPLCGTQAGGWGIAETKSPAKPYFVTGSTAVSGGYNTYVYANEASSTTELVHVVATYDCDNMSSSIYVNGVKNSTEAIKTPFKPGAGEAYNKFCLGCDVTQSGVGGDFPASKMIMVSARIWRGVLTSDEVSAAYDSSLKLLE